MIGFVVRLGYVWLRKRRPLIVNAAYSGWMFTIAGLMLLMSTTGHNSQ